MVVVSVMIVAVVVCGSGWLLTINTDMPTKSAGTINHTRYGRSSSGSSHLSVTSARIAIVKNTHCVHTYLVGAMRVFGSEDEC